MITATATVTSYKTYVVLNESNVVQAITPCNAGYIPQKATIKLW